MANLSALGRRNMTIKALWRKRNVRKKGDNENLSYEEQGTFFYAMESGTRVVDTDEILNGTIRNPYIETTLVTYDKVWDMKVDDRVIYFGKEYIVTNVSSQPIVARSNFIQEKVTTISLRGK